MTRTVRLNTALLLGSFTKYWPPPQTTVRTAPVWFIRATGEPTYPSPLKSSPCVLTVREPRPTSVCDSRSLFSVLCYAQTNVFAFGTQIGDGDQKMANLATKREESAQFMTGSVSLSHWQSCFLIERFKRATLFFAFDLIDSVPLACCSPCVSVG